MRNLEFTGERYVPWMGPGEIHYEHLHRYRFAREFVKDKKVLDLACGEGYGSFMLSEEADEIIGIDIDEVTIRHASSKYIKENLRFIKGSIIDVPIKDEKIFDVIVCFEALEHIEEHDKLINEVKRLLKDDGIFIVSTPNKYVYSDQPSYKNPFHVRELYFDEFKTLLNNNFKNTLIYGQKVYPASNIFPLYSNATIMKDFAIQRSDNEFLFIPPERKEALYFIAISSDFPIKEVIGNSYLVDVSETLFRQKDTHIGNLEASIRDKDTQVGNLEAAVREKDAHITNLEAAVREKDAHITNLEAVIRDKDTTLNNIYNSHGWKALLVYYKVRNRLLPVGTKRRKIVKNIFRVLWKTLIYTEKSLSYAKQFGVKALFFKIKDKMLDRYMNNIKSFDLNYEDLLHTITKTKPPVDIIIVTFNSQNTIEKCISGILTSSYENIGKIIIVDNNSNDQTITITKNIFVNFHQDFLVLSNKKNLGFGKAVNIGANHSDSDLLLFLNPDAVLYSDTISVLVDNMNNFGEKCAAVEARQIPFEHPKLYNPISMDVVWCSGCCLLVRKKTFTEVGGFDENIFLYADDVDLSWRLKSLGYSIKYCPTALVYHEIDPDQARPHQKKYGPLSNLYLRTKYGVKVGNWFVSTIWAIMKRDMRLPNVLSVLSYLWRGWSNRFREGKNLKKLFPTLGFGYEILRRRGHDVATLPFPQNNLVSVIMRTHNRPELLRRALISVFHQSYKNIEVIVVEDRTDTAPLIIEEFKDLLTVRYFRYTGTKGRTGTLNLGLINAKGDWIYILDDDDVIFADTIETLLSYAIKTTSLMVYGGALEMLTDDKWTGILKHGCFHIYDKEKLKRENFIPIGAFIFYRTLFETLGLFDEKLELLEDWDFLRRLSRITDFTFVPKDLLIFLTPQDSQARLERQSKLDAAYKYVVEKN